MKKKTNILAYCLPPNVVVGVDTVDVAVVVVSTFRAKLIPNGMQKAAAARTAIIIPKIIQNNLSLFFLFTLDSSFDTDRRIISVSFLKLLKD